MTPSSWVVDIDPAVPGRIRLARGVFWAQIVAAMTAALVGAYGSGQLFGWLASSLFGLDKASLPRAGTGFLIILVALAAGVVVFRFIGRLRTGSLIAARTTLVLCLIWLAVGLRAGLTGVYSTDDGCGLGWLGLICGAIHSVGAAAYRITEGISQNPGTSTYYAIVLAVLLNSSPLGERLRRSAWMRFRLIRWPILFMAGAIALALPISAIEMFKDSQWSSSQIGVVVTIPVLYLALRAACEVLQPGAPTILPPGWEPSPVQRATWSGGRRRIRVVVLIGASALCGLLWYTLTMTLPTSMQDSLLSSADSSLSLNDFVGLRVIALAFPLVFLLLAVELYTRARRNAAISAAALRDRDTRSPILYLRSFTDDALKVSTHGSPRHSWFERFLLRRRERFEVMLIWHLWRYGPVVCIGGPLENLPLLGAARDYLSDSEWRDGVEARIREAAAIVVVLGHSEGLAWELEAIERLGAKGKTLIVIPPAPERSISERWDAFDGIAGKLGWRPVAANHRDDVLVATLQADATRSDEESHPIHGDASTWALFRGSVRDEWHYEIALEAAIRYLERRPRSGIAALAIPPTAKELGPPPAGILSAARALSARLGRRWTEGPLLMVFVFYFVGVLYVVGSPGRTERVADLHRGMCISEIPASVFESVDEDDKLLLAGRVYVDSCYESHGYEVSRTAPLTFNDYSSDSALSAAAEEICGSAFDAYVGPKANSRTLDYAWLLPSLDEWKLGFRKVICLVYDKNGALASKVGNRND